MVDIPPPCPLPPWFPPPWGGDYQIGDHLATFLTLSQTGEIVDSLLDVKTQEKQIATDFDLGPFLYMPKLHSGVEADVLERVLAYCEKQLRLNENSTKVTTLIETLPAVFQTEEIAFALKNRIVGQNCGVHVISGPDSSSLFSLGRWDWLASRNYYLSGQNEAIHPDQGISYN